MERRKVLATNGRTLAILYHNTEDSTLGSSYMDSRTKEEQIMTRNIHIEPEHIRPMMHSFVFEFIMRGWQPVTQSQWEDC